VGGSGAKNPIIQFLSVLTVRKIPRSTVFINLSLRRIDYIRDESESSATVRFLVAHNGYVDQFAIALEVILKIRFFR